MKFILGKKSGMTTIYKEDKAHNVSLIEIIPNKVDKIRTVELDGYQAVRILVPKTKNIDYKKEFRVDTVDDYKVGKELEIDIFKEGDIVSVSGISKAKGFQGVVKRHGFKGGPATHGHRHVLRAPGSIGSAYPQHVLKGKKMAGRMGGERVVSQNLKVVLVDKKNNLMAVEGAIPGVAGRIVEIVSVDKV
jgi:large subunit ribosomal protein L3